MSAAEIEQWKAVAGLEASHAVSSLGRIRSLPRMSRRATRKRMVYGCILSLWKNGKGYVFVALRPMPRAAVHRIVAEAFIPNPNALPVVNHINGIRDDNRVSNLEWCTRSHNSWHSRNVLGSCIGERHFAARLSRDLVDELKALRSYGATYTNLGKAYGVTPQCVRSAITGRTWKTAA